MTVAPPFWIWCEIISDEEIEAAQSFDGYSIRDRLSWPTHAVPCGDGTRQYHAYHIQQLAVAMQTSGRWVGSPPTRWDKGADGSHRVRAIQYLETKGILIEIPKVREI